MTCLLTVLTPLAIKPVFTSSETVTKTETMTETETEKETDEPYINNEYRFKL